VCVPHIVKNGLAIYGYGSSGGKGFDQTVMLPDIRSLMGRLFAMRTIISISR
jgi:hypothetical protein